MQTISNFKTFKRVAVVKAKCKRPKCGQAQFVSVSVYLMCICTVVSGSKGPPDKAINAIFFQPH